MKGDHYTPHQDNEKKHEYETTEHPNEDFDNTPISVEEEKLIEKSVSKGTSNQNNNKEEITEIQSAN